MFGKRENDSLNSLEASSKAKKQTNKIKPNNRDKFLLIVSIKLYNAIVLNHDYQTDHQLSAALNRKPLRRAYLSIVKHRKSIASITSDHFHAKFF